MTEQLTKEEEERLTFEKRQEEAEQAERSEGFYSKSAANYEHENETDTD